MHLEVSRSPEEGGVVGEGVLRLSDADGELVVAQLVDHLERLDGLLVVDYAVCPVDLSREGLDLLLDRAAEVVAEGEGLRGVVVDGVDDYLCQLGGSLTALGEGVIDGEGYAELLAVEADRLELSLGIGGEAVDADDDALSKLPHILHVLVEVGEALLQRLHILRAEVGVLDSAVELEGLGSGDEDRGSGLETILTADDVEELLCAEVSTEACLRDGVVAVVDRHLGGDDGVAAVSDIGKWTAVDEGGGILGRLDEIRLEGVHQEDGDRTADLHVPYGEGAAVLLVPHDDVVDAATEVVHVLGETEDRHNLGCGRDVKSCLIHFTITIPETGDNVADAAVVDVEDAPPGDLGETLIVVAVTVGVVVDEGGDGVIG